jgi:ferredoxin/flavodoxin---NADP+ reductase
MFPVLQAETIGPAITRLRVLAPRVAAHRRPGQFAIVRPLQDSERIPLTIADADPEAGTITLIVQAVGRTTRILCALRPGEGVADVLGPLGRPTETVRVGSVAVVAGGVGSAIVYPRAVALRAAGNTVVGILGGRTGPLVTLECELRAACDDLRVTTDDGSAGRRGLVTDELADLLVQRTLDLVLAAGPVPMMAAVAALTDEHGVRTLCSLNPIMVDGTGMCGGCRVDVGGETRFACVDGPEFDAHAVDFDLLAKRNRAYADFERRQAELTPCRAVATA